MKTKTPIKVNNAKDLVRVAKENKNTDIIFKEETPKRIYNSLENKDKGVISNTPKTRKTETITRQSEVSELNSPDTKIVGHNISEESKERFARINRIYEGAKKESRAEMKKEILAILNGRTIECTMKYGRWYMNLNSLIEKIEAIK